MRFFCHLCSHSHFCLASIPSISPRLLPLFMLYLSHPLSVSGSSTSSHGAGVGQRGWGWRLGLVVGWRGRCLGIERRGAWPLVCLGAPNESMIHGTRGSHRDRIRGALSNCSPERVKRYLICPPRRQLPLGFVCVSTGVRACFCECGGRLLAEGGSADPYSHAAKLINYFSCSFF